MSRVKRMTEKHDGGLRTWTLLLLLLVIAFPAMAKAEVDFNPDLGYV